MKVGEGKPGPVTNKLQREFLEIVHNANDKHGWLYFIYND
jgi:hypothetical protein